MPHKSKKTLFYLVTTLVVFALGTNLFYKGGQVKLVETSVLSLLENLVETYDIQPADVEIEKVVLVKKQDPKPDFNYYKYKATVVLKNNGGHLRNARVILKSSDGSSKVLANNENGKFDLKRDEVYILKNHEVLFDGNYNGGKLNFSINITDGFDFDMENNNFNAEVFDDEALLTEIEVSDFKNGVVEIDFDATKYMLREHKYELFFGTELDEEGRGKYGEAFNGGEILNYEVLENSYDNFVLNSVSGNLNEVKKVNFGANPWEDEKDYYFFVKATDPLSGKYAISDLVRINGSRVLNRAEFAKMFVELSGAPVSYEGRVHYSDVKADDWYAPYVQSLYNAGLLKLNANDFGPNETMTRGGALMLVMDYFDADLQIPNGAPHFQDVHPGNPLYFYVESYFGGDLPRRGKKFGSGMPVTESFLRHLVEEYNY